MTRAARWRDRAARAGLTLAWAGLLGWGVACQERAGDPDAGAVESTDSARGPEGLDPERPPERLSSFGLFDELRSMTVAPGWIAYELKSGLFSDHTEKLRQIHLPAGGTMRADRVDALGFPVRTILAKTFFYDGVDGADREESRRLLETRILWHTERGWIGLPYVWDEDGVDAVLRRTGALLRVARDADGERLEHDYLVPNQNQCAQCHDLRGRGNEPLGPTLRNLDRRSRWSPDAAQPDAWAARGLLTGLEDARPWQELADYDDPSADLDLRARSWLEVQCAHCHNPEGPARTSGLDLRLAQSDPALWGVGKAPVAAGPGTAGRSVVIVPGDAEASILTHRIASTAPGVMMPELGNQFVHEEGIALVRAWIASLDIPQE